MSEPAQVRGVIAVDGPAGAGKSSAARALADRLDAVLLDTGALYRAVALVSREQGVEWDDGPGLAAVVAGLAVRFERGRTPQGVFVGERDITTAIRTPQMSRGASMVSQYPEVRRALLTIQRRLAGSGLVVAEGRDMGTVVFPDALIKFFLTASDEVRAQRRHQELVEQGEEVGFEEVLEAQQQRDREDIQRAASPLRQAPDAVVVDSTHLDLGEVVDRMLAAVAFAAELRELEARLQDRQAALPAHSVRSHQLIEVEDLEEEIRNKKAELARLFSRDSGVAGSEGKNC